MKCWILCFCFLITHLTWSQKIAQKDVNPSQRTVPGGGRITQIEYTRHKMIVHFVTKSNQHSSLYGPGHRHAWRLYDTKSGKQYNLIYIKNITVNGIQEVDYLDSPKGVEFFYVESLKCEAHFERPGKGVTKVNLIEEDVEQFVDRPNALGNGTSSQWPYNIYDVRVLPYDDAEEPATVRRENRPLPETAKPKSLPTAPTAPPVAKTPPRTPAKSTPAKPRVPQSDSALAGRPPVKTSPKIENFGNRVETGKTYRLSNLLFEQSDYRIQPTSYAELNKLADVMRENPEIKIELSGHTDNVGDPKLNIELSRKRVEAVKSYLVSKGISRDRIQTVAYGGSKPISDNNREDTRRLNRRVEVRVI